MTTLIATQCACSAAVAALALLGISPLPAAGGVTVLTVVIWSLS